MSSRRRARSAPSTVAESDFGCPSAASDDSGASKRRRGEGVRPAPLAAQADDALPTRDNCKELESASEPAVGEEQPATGGHEVHVPEGPLEGAIAPCTDQQPSVAF